MNTEQTISNIITSLSDAISDADWSAVESVITDLNVLNEELQSDYPFEDVENDD